MSNAELAPVGTKDMTMNEAPSGTMGMIERAASDPNFDADKFKTLVGLRNDERAWNAKQAFNVAMAGAQREMRPVAADCDNPQTRSRYASYAQLDRAIRPIYSRHGFALSFNTADCPLDAHMRIICLVSHESGHERTYQIDMPSDGKGAKGGDVMTKTHASGAAGSYGMRYLLKMIFNISVGEDDRDGNDAHAVKDPAGFADWLADMDVVAEDGLIALQSAWDKSSASFKRHSAKHYRGEHETRKRKAAKADEARKVAAS